MLDNNRAHTVTNSARHRVQGPRIVCAGVRIAPLPGLLLRIRSLDLNMTNFPGPFLEVIGRLFAAFVQQVVCRETAVPTTYSYLRNVLIHALSCSVVSKSLWARKYDGRHAHLRPIIARVLCYFASGFQHSVESRVSEI